MGLHDGWQNRASAYVAYEYIVLEENNTLPNILLLITNIRGPIAPHIDKWMTRQTLSMLNIIIIITIVSLIVGYLECIFHRRI